MSLRAQRRSNPDRAALGWNALRSLSSGRPLRAGPVGSQRRKLSSQQFHRLSVHAPVARRDDAAAAMRPAVVPGGDDAARAFDDRNEREHIVWLEFGLDEKIDMAGGEHAIGVAIAAIARQLHRLL